MKRILLPNEFGILITFLCTFLSASTLYAEEELVAEYTCKEGIPWEGKCYKPYDAYISFIRVSPTTLEDEADSIRIRFSCNVRDIDKKQKPPRITTYFQTWKLTADTLETCSVLSTYKIYVDGVYKRDSVGITETKYRVYGPMVLKQYNFRENNIPTGRADETIHKGYSYFPVSEDLFNWLKGFNCFPIKESSEEILTLFENEVRLIGPDSTYTVNFGKNNKIIAKVLYNRMEVSIIENNSPNVFIFSKANRSHTRSYTINKENYIRIYAGEGDKSPYIEILENKILINYLNKLKSYYIDVTQLLKAVRLAKVRFILEDDNANEELNEWLDDFSY